MILDKSLPLSWPLHNGNGEVSDFPVTADPGLSPP